MRTCGIVFAFVCVRSHRRLGRQSSLKSSFSNSCALTNLPFNFNSFSASQIRPSPKVVKPILARRRRWHPAFPIRPPVQSLFTTYSHNVHNPGHRARSHRFQLAIFAQSAYKFISVAILGLAGGVGRAPFRPAWDQTDEAPNLYRPFLRMRRGYEARRR